MGEIIELLAVGALSHERNQRNGDRTRNDRETEERSVLSRIEEEKRRG